MIDPGTVIDDRYEVLERVGSGGMADVYLASDRLLGRRVAVKVLHHRFAEDEEFVERFKREASSAAGLSHPNVVSIFDRGAWDGTLYIAMEYLPGSTLKQLLRERGPLAPAAAIDIALQILRAARFAHRRGVIHRDLKPHNVILDEEGRAKVTDFGIARAGASDMTLTGSIMGTAQYLSPEQAQGQSVTESSDLYAVGVVLYELLVGKVPFEGETAVTIALQHISRQAPAPSDANPAVPAALDAIVLRMMAKEPSDRYASTGDAIAALEAVRASLPEPVGEHVLAAAPRGTPLAAGVPSEGARGIARAGSATATAGMLAAYGTGEHPTGSQEAAEDAGGGSRRRRVALLTGAVVLLLAIVAVLLVLLLPASTHTVPEVVGRTQARATAILEHAGFKVEVEKGANAHVASGSVVSTTPQAGSSLKRGSVVTIMVSTGRGSTAVPSVSGLSQSAASKRLRNASLRPVVSGRASEIVPAGGAIGTEPATGRRAPDGSDVTLLISTGPAKVAVPHVREESIEEAEAVLEEAGLALHIDERPDSSRAAGTVLSQAPGSGTRVAPGSTVSLVIAKAAPKKQVKASVPSVLEDSQAEAEKMLNREGLTVRVAYRSVSETAEVGKVVAQDPTPGSRVSRESRVTIYLGRLATTSTSTTDTTTSTSTTDTTAGAPAG